LNFSTFTAVVGITDVYGHPVQRSIQELRARYDASRYMVNYLVDLPSIYRDPGYSDRLRKARGLSADMAHDWRKQRSVLRQEFFNRRQPTSSPSRTHRPAGEASRQHGRKAG
jgi:hypothetical protein